jgi:3-isopropylmalate/(R)-2-methylmalate dehydratase large subunit
MVALPGDPRNGVPLGVARAGKQGGEVKIHIAYGGSCTGGKKADMDMYAEVLARAVERGERVAEGVHLYIQFGSQDIRALRRAEGLHRRLREGGRRARRPVVRRLHQGRARASRSRRTRSP